MNTQAILQILDDMYEKWPPYRSNWYNVAIREIKEHILEMEENEDDWLLFWWWDRKWKEISSLPSLDIDSLWNYDYTETWMEYVWTAWMWEYIRYDDLKKLLQD